MRLSGNGSGLVVTDVQLQNGWPSSKEDFLFLNKK